MKQRQLLVAFACLVPIEAASMAILAGCVSMLKTGGHGSFLILLPVGAALFVLQVVVGPSIVSSIIRPSQSRYTGGSHLEAIAVGALLGAFFSGITVWGGRPFYVSGLIWWFLGGIHLAHAIVSPVVIGALRAREPPKKGVATVNQIPATPSSVSSPSWRPLLWAIVVGLVLDLPFWPARFLVPFILPVVCAIAAISALRQPIPSAALLPAILMGYGVELLLAPFYIFVIRAHWLTAMVTAASRTVTAYAVVRRLGAAPEPSKVSPNLILIVVSLMLGRVVAVELASKGEAAAPPLAQSSTAAPKNPSKAPVPSQTRIIGASSFLSDATRLQTGESSDFRPERLMDGNPSTAWCEGVPGAGIGEWIDFELSQPQGVLQIQNGLQKPRLNSSGVADNAIYSWNNRPKVLDLSGPSGNFRLHLEDTTKLQDFALELPPGAYRMTISEVYQGSRFDDTCLGKIHFYSMGFGDARGPVPVRPANETLLRPELAIASDLRGLWKCEGLGGQRFVRLWAMPGLPVKGFRALVESGEYEPFVGFDVQPRLARDIGTFSLVAETSRARFDFNDAFGNPSIWIEGSMSIWDGHSGTIDALSKNVKGDKSVRLTVRKESSDRASVDVQMEPSPGAGMVPFASIRCDRY